MTVEAELLKLCEQFIEVLHYLKEQSVITEEEFKKHLEQKVKFVESIIGISKVE